MSIFEGFFFFLLSGSSVVGKVEANTKHCSPNVWSMCRLWKPNDRRRVSQPNKRPTSSVGGTRRANKTGRLRSDDVTLTTTNTDRIADPKTGGAIPT